MKGTAVLAILLTVAVSMVLSQRSGAASTLRYGKRGEYFRMSPSQRGSMEVRKRREEQARQAARVRAYYARQRRGGASTLGYMTPIEQQRFFYWKRREDLARQGGATATLGVNRRHKALEAERIRQLVASRRRRFKHVSTLAFGIPRTRQPSQAELAKYAEYERQLEIKLAREAKAEAELERQTRMSKRRRNENSSRRRRQRNTRTLAYYDPRYRWMQAQLAKQAALAKQAEAERAERARTKLGREGYMQAHPAKVYGYPKGSPAATALVIQRAKALERRRQLDREREIQRAIQAQREKIYRWTQDSYRASLRRGNVRTLRYNKRGEYFRLSPSQRGSMEVRKRREEQARQAARVRAYYARQRRGGASTLGYKIDNSWLVQDVLEKRAQREEAQRRKEALEIQRVNQQIRAARAKRAQAAMRAGTVKKVKHVRTLAFPHPKRIM